MHALFITPRLFEEMLRNSQAQALTVKVKIFVSLRYH